MGRNMKLSATYFNGEHVLEHIDSALTFSIVIGIRPEEFEEFTTSHQYTQLQRLVDQLSKYTDQIFKGKIPVCVDIYAFDHEPELLAKSTLAVYLEYDSFKTKILDTINFDLERFSEIVISAIDDYMMSRRLPIPGSEWVHFKEYNDYIASSRKDRCKYVYVLDCIAKSTDDLSFLAVYRKKCPSSSGSGITWVRNVSEFLSEVPEASKNFTDAKYRFTRIS